MYTIVYLMLQIMHMEVVLICDKKRGHRNDLWRGV